MLVFILKEKGPGIAKTDGIGCPAQIQLEEHMCKAREHMLCLHHHSKWNCHV
jgi:hypothetical protein